MNDRAVRELEERAVKLASAGAVGASVAHELRNALAVAESSLFLARRDVDRRDHVLRHLDKVTTEIRRAQRVIGAVLGLARGDAVTSEPVALATLVDAARGTIVLPTNVTFSVAITPTDLVVRCDPVLLERVLSNLYVNAIDALAGRGRGEIVTRAERQGKQVVVAVEDDGPGLDPSLSSSLFDPLVSTKPSGSGLGLAICRTIVEAHGGQIRVETSRAGGARFAFALPS